MKKSISDLDVHGKRVLVRVDFNVPIDRDGRVEDDSRIRASLPTIRTLTERGAKVILLSHLGRPKGGRVESLSLAPVARWLSALLGEQVRFAEGSVGEGAEQAIAGLSDGEVLLLENVRFHSGETRNAPDLAAAMARLGDLFVNDAFSVAHREHVSTCGIPRHLPAVAGLLMEREMKALGRLLSPEKPFMAVVGGAKVSDKLVVLQNLLPKVDKMLFGGGLGNTLLRALGYEMGKSLVEEDQVRRSESLIAAAREADVELLLPIDLVVGDFFREEANRKVVSVNRIPPDWIAMDIGPSTVDRYIKALAPAKTIFWNGPLGVAEWPNFAKGTTALARALAQSKAFTVVGGGDSIAALGGSRLRDRFDHVSTGGGASLAFLEGKPLPAIACLDEA